MRVMTKKSGEQELGAWSPSKLSVLLPHDVREYWITVNDFERSAGWEYRQLPIVTLTNRNKHTLLI